MIRTPNVFSDNALFLHSAPLTVKGKADPGEKIEIILSLGGEVCGSWDGEAEGNGDFSVTITTPAASFDVYELAIKGESDEKVIKGILFGELWMACGQSNMEMSNAQQMQWQEMSETIKGKQLRFFNQPRLLHTDNFPFDPSAETEGWWVTPEETDKAAAVSAVATKFSNELYDFLKAKGENCPVGFLNTNRGGTCIETWIPKEAFAEDERIAYREPKLEGWNEKGEGNYQQPSAHFNRHVGAVFGLRARGMLWYQGESNLNAEQTKHIYKHYMVALRESYKKLFAASEDEIFPIISSQIYPWRYVTTDDTGVGYLNQCFTDLAKAFPKEYPFIPICDLKPIWNYFNGNHPIHPAHKYALGERMVKLTENIYYGREGKNIQKLPPILKSCVRHGNKLRLTFENVGSGLYVDGKKARGLYVRSKDGAYTPAYFEIVSKSVMNVYHPYIEKPVHVAYAVSSMETRTNLFAGEFPVTPFCTEFGGGDNAVKISVKPWLDNSNDNEFVCDFSDGLNNVFNMAVFNPCDNSSVCYDSDFTLTGRSVRIYAKSNSDLTFGVYLLARQYTSLDFENYEAMKLQIYNARKITAKLILYYKEDNGSKVIHTVTAEKTSDMKSGWTEHSFDFSSIPVGIIEKAEFSFTLAEKQLSFVNIDDIVLVPKK